VNPSLTQGLLALGGEEMSRVLLRVLDEGQNWRRAAEGAGVDLDALLLSERGPEAVFPWEPLVNLAGRRGLEADYRRAMNGEA